jgi:hypothetical protein
VEPSPGESVLAAASALDYRAMLLIYLELPVDRFTEYDAHYFPGEEVAITRLSETKNYSGSNEPAGRTVLCAELPCQPEDDVWAMPEEELGRLVMADLERGWHPGAGRPVQHPRAAASAGVPDLHARLRGPVRRARRVGLRAARPPQLRAAGPLRARQHAPRPRDGLRRRRLPLTERVRRGEVGPLPPDFEKHVVVD